MQENVGLALALSSIRKHEIVLYEVDCIEHGHQVIIVSKFGWPNDVLFFLDLFERNRESRLQLLLGRRHKGQWLFQVLQGLAEDLLNKKHEVLFCVVEFSEFRPTHIDLLVDAVRNLLCLDVLVLF